MIPALMPGIGLIFMGCLLLVSGLLGSQHSVDTSPKKSASHDTYAWVSLLTILCVWFGWFSIKNITEQTSAGLFRQDQVSYLGTHLSLLGGSLFIMVVHGFTPSRFASEFHGCYLILLAGLIVVASSADLTTLYLGLELVSIPTTIMLALSSKDRYGLEATLKYFSLSGLSSAFFLMGASYLYGLAGSTSLEKIVSVVSSAPSLMTQMSMALVLASLAFRVTAVPFHFYAPDVFTGTSFPMAALISTLPKLAGFLAIIRIFGGSTLSAGLLASVETCLIVLVLTTMTLGNMLALVQVNVKRLLAYSSVSHSGYILLGVLAALTHGGSPNIVFIYLAAYLVMTFGLFAGLINHFADSRATIELDDLKGISQDKPWISLAMTICLLSMIGVPITAGFWAKFQIFMSAATTKTPWLNICATLMAFNAAISAIYYLSFIARMYDVPVKGTTPSQSPMFNLTGYACLGCSGLTLLWFFLPL